MQSRFGFLEGRFPKLAEYGRKAEEAFAKDNNICLLNLGRIAETITDILCRKNNIRPEDGVPDKLLEAEIIDSNTLLKIKTLTEIKEDAANNSYASETAASRMMASALELCEWFISDEGAGRFAFLEDIFPENASFPPLAVLAEYGREAEENLCGNTRYCLLCLGDIEEAIVDILLDMKGVKVQHGLDQDKRINLLFKAIGMENKDKIDMLHQIRQIRNDAVHSRYDSEQDSRKFLDETLKLCEWLFMFMITPGDFLKGSITEAAEEGLSVSAGKICGTVPADELPGEDSVCLQESYRKGERKIFRVTAKDEDRITLSLRQVYTNPWLNMARRYEKYRPGQILNVRVKRTADNMGAFVEVSDSAEGLEARIPRCEFGTWSNPAKAKDAMRAGDTMKACVKWVNPEHYPYMILSIADAEEQAHEEEAESRPDKWESLTERGDASGMPDDEFRIFCRKASHMQIVSALDGGANPNASNKLGTTALMSAAQFNADREAVNELLKAGVDVNAKNHHGNTALIFAAMQSTPEVVRLLCEHGAEIGIKNNDGKKARDYAKENPRLKNDAGILHLLADEGDLEEQESEVKALPERKKKGAALSDGEFLRLCRHGKEQNIIKAINNGANVNASDNNRTTALMYVSMRSVSGALRALLEHGAEVNAMNKNKVTALMMAVMNTRSKNIGILLEHGADVLSANKKGKTVLDYAREKLSGKKSHDLLDRIEAEVRALSEQEEGHVQEALTEQEETSSLQEDFTEHEEIVPLQEVSAGNEETTITQEVMSEPEETSSHQEVPAEQKEASSLQEDFTEHEEIVPLQEVSTGQREEASPQEKISEPEEKAIQQEVPAKPENISSSQDIISARENEAQTEEAIPQQETLAERGDEALPQETFTEQEETSSLQEAFTEQEEIVPLQEVSAGNEETTITQEVMSEHKAASSQQEASAEQEEAVFQQGIISEHKETSPQQEISAEHEDSPSAHEATAEPEESSSQQEISAEHEISSGLQDAPLTEEQHEEARKVLRMTLQRDLLKICRSGIADDITQALEAGVNISVRNKNGASPLMFAARDNTSEILDMLINAGAEVNARDRSGNTALIYAASCNTDDAVNVLLDAGADKGLINTAGFTALDYARRNYRLADTQALSRLEE